MADHKTFAVVDVGSTKVVALIAEESADAERGYSIIGVGITSSRGITRGQVSDVAEATEAIRDAINGAEQSSGVMVQDVLMSVNGVHIDSLNNHGTVAVSRGDDGVTEDDVARGLEAAQAISLPSNRDVIHAVARSYKIDDHDGVRNPLGMLGFRLEVQAHIVTVTNTAQQNLFKCAGAAGLTANEVVFAGLASAQAVLNPMEREMGAVLVDIGGGTTSIVVYIDDRPWHSQVLGLGGAHFTRDLAQVFHIPIDAAEALKVSEGTLSMDGPDVHGYHEVPGFGDEGIVRIARRDAAEVLQARAHELFEKVEKEIKRSGYDGMLAAGLVLTGGGARLPGMREAAREATRRQVRVARPLNLDGLVDSIHSEEYSAVIGLADWMQKQMPTRSPSRARGGRSFGSGSPWRERAAQFIRRLLP
jgi:cell division protein FtsA